MNAMPPDPVQALEQAARAARAATTALAAAPTAIKDQALMLAAAALREHAGGIIAANAEDIAAAPGLSPAFRDRLLLNTARVEAMAKGLEEVAALPDPVGRVLSEWKRPNGLRLQRVAQPLGVIGMIFESRPNVTADAAALCLKSGNAVILRGGSESIRSAAAIHACMVEGLRMAGLPEAAVQVAPSADRAFVGAMLRASGLIDLIVPRGGKGLVTRVLEEARVPVLADLRAEYSGLELIALDPADASLVADAVPVLESLTDTLDQLIIAPAEPGQHEKLADTERDELLSTLSGTGLTEHYRRHAVAPLLLVRTLLPFLATRDGARVLVVSSWLGSLAGKTQGGDYATCASSAANAVHISFFIFWTLIINYVCDAIDINTAGSNISCN